MKSSFSQNSTYIQCPKYWYWLYVKKIKSDFKKASAYFGNAVDNSVMELLKSGPTGNYLQVFHNSWKILTQYNKPTQIFDNPEIMYAHGDFDEHVLNSSDLQLLQKWAIELKVDKLGNTGVAIYKSVSKIKKNPYKRTKPEELQYFNRASWLSLDRKGEVLIEAFKEQFYPKIKKLLATQKSVNINDPATGDSIIGLIDIVAEIEGYDKPIILDLKTSATPYSQEDIELKEQLPLYLAMAGQEYNTNLVGYVVLCKNIPKELESVCSVCGNKKDSQHRTCNNMLKGARCGGSWNETRILKPEVQIMVESKTQEQVQELLNDSANVMAAMKAGIIYKNTSKCNFWFGSRCQFYDYCHNGRQVE